MAFTDTDKDCLRGYQAHLLNKERTGRLEGADAADYETITTGTEAEKQVVAKWFAENVTLVAVQARLANIDAEKTALQAEETALLAYIA